MPRPDIPHAMELDSDPITDPDGGTGLKIRGTAEKAPLMTYVLVAEERREQKQKGKHVEQVADSLNSSQTPRKKIDQVRKLGTNSIGCAKQTSARQSYT